VPGDTQRNLRIFPTFSGRTFKHVLVPIWLLTYTYGAKAFQVIVNGYTGKIAGKYPLSVWKVLFAILVVLIVVIAIASLND
jgi:small-conductance mechanosensitive channel